MLLQRVLVGELELIILPEDYREINIRLNSLESYDFVLGLNLIDRKLITSLKGQLSFRFVYGSTVAEIFEKLASTKIHIL